MSHLDEGQLHGYLDGQWQDGTAAERHALEQHLAQCAECRGRLEGERRIRERAQAVLRAAGPASLSAPPFEAILERDRERARRPRIRPTVALAWAASLALAVTVGWYARSLALANGAGVAAEAAGAAEAEVRADAIQATPPRTTQVAQAAPAREATVQPPRPAAGTGAVTSTAGPTLQDRAVANLAAAEAKAERDTEPTPLRVAEAPAPSAAPAIALRRQPGVTTPELEQTWITVSSAEAERRLGGPLATIPELPSLGTSVFGTGPSTIARTIQVLGPGLTIELVQQRATPSAERAARERAAAPAAMPEAGRALRDEPGQSVTVQWERFSVTGRALVPADSLRKLLQTLRAPDPLR